MINVFLNWHLGNTFGWGILGLNLFSHWANDGEIRPLMGHRIMPDALAACDPLRISRVYPAIDFSNRFLADLRAGSDGRKPIDAIVVDALGNDFAPSDCYGRRNIGRCIFEHPPAPHLAAALAKYDALLVGSRWNAALLEAATGRASRVIFEGVDTSLFCPGPKSGLMDPTKFYVFSGGKAEFRKGQDLVLLAFRQFLAMHDDCVLVTAWHSIWPNRSVGFKGKLKAALEIGANGRLDFAKWGFDNGVDPRSMIDIGLAPNTLMPAVLREMDVALQPSRAEACTSLPVKEAMACGIPVIAARNTGMADLLDDCNSLMLHRQTRVVDTHDAAALEDWGECDVDEIIAALEFAYTQRAEARRIGAKAREWLIDHGRTWQHHADEAKRWILS